MDLQMSVVFLCSVIWASILFLMFNSRARRSAKLPPGPYQFPIIGNILKLGDKPHKSLAELSKIYGPIMSLKLGSITAVVVSSPELAKVVLQTNDLVFSSRTVPRVAENLSHDKFSMAWLPVQAQWRKLRKICKELMFSVHSLDASRSLRREKLEKLSEYLKESCQKGQVVDIANASFTTALNLISATLFSTEFVDFNSGSSHEMKDVVCGVMECIGKPNLADYFPVLKALDPQGIMRETKFYFERLFAIFDRIIDEKLKTRARGQKHEENDLVEALLDLNQKEDPELSRNDINHLLLDLFTAGTDTTTVTVEWAMAELLRNPDKLSKARSEIKSIIGADTEVQESDISKLQYLQAVVKETFRLHPPGPFLIPHKAEADIDISGYIVPKNAQILVNTWAIGRDSSIWPDADLFIPERFLDSDTDFRGKDFELIPFGSGRRMCPGLPLAYRMVHMVLARIVHKFDWKLEDKITPQEIDMTENFGLTLQKFMPLKAIPIEL